MIDLNKYTVKIDYPCNWEYKIIIHHEQTIEDIMQEVLERRKHNIQPSNKSTKGRFKSYTLEMLVHNENDRKELYKLLTDHKHIKMVL
ncbi:hypothetical protein MNB_ARC-1_466 [hydrothermal vent metagenome]|uniref:Proposed lipoate regulatory protein YbeD n=1 Tax=hydrothermal vent metagenome TaxID=652676 RepID=A0A3B1EA79_9ZZZZ